MTALSSLDGGAPGNAIYVGDGVTSAADKLSFDTGKQQVRAVTVGHFGGKAARLVTALDDQGRARIYGV